MIHGLLCEFGAYGENCDVEKIGFDQFQDMARGEGRIVYGEFTIIDVFLQDCGDPAVAA